MNKISFFLIALLLGIFTLPSYAQNIVYQVHIADGGWLARVQDGAMGGTEGKGLQMEAIAIGIRGLPSSCTLQYNVHAADIGWMGWVGSPEMAGTTGQNRRLEAVMIRLIRCPGWGVQYKVHAANIGWMGWEFDGGLAGTTGQSRQIEAIKILLRRR